MFRVLLPSLLSLLLGWELRAAPLTDPAVDGFNIRIGTQTFAPKYRFTTNTVLVETAQAIRDMGSDVVKFYMGKGFGGQYPGITLPATVTNLLTLARDEPSCRRVLDMPFRHYLIWSYCFAATADAWWSDGFSASERQKEYSELYAFTRYLLTNYNHSGKSFYLGHWEGDWYLLPGYNTAINPSPTAIQGMIDWLNTRQQAVDDATRDTAHTNVAVFHYTEVNRVRDAMLNASTNNQRLVNTVLPYVTNLDFVSWSSYDGMDLGASDLYATLNYIEAHLPTNKAAGLPGKRVLVGEYGWGGSKTSAEQEPLTRAYIQKLLTWGARFILFWEMYDNEGKAYWLIDSAGNKTPCYDLHQRLANHARLQAARFKEANRRLPTDAEFAALVTPTLEQPLPVPQALTLSSQALLAITGSVATVAVRLAQGIYGDDGATVRVHWGAQDGGTNQAAWSSFRIVGVNTNFNPSVFRVELPNLTPGSNVFFRFQATNQTGEVWATNSIQFKVEALNPADFGSRLRIGFPGYTRDEPLTGFPALVLLGTHIPGFSYQQFASPTGGDLRFANASGTVPIPHEVDEWNTNGVSSVWVRLPALSGTNEGIWAFWGNPLATNPPATSTNGAVWADGFELVWHFREAALPHADSTLKHPATVGVNPAWTAAGMVGHGCVFNGTSSYLSAGTVNLGDQFTLSTWAKLDATATSIQTLWGSKNGGSATDGLAFFVNSWQTSDRKVLFETGNGSAGRIAATPANVVNPGVWHHLAVTVDRGAGEARVFVNGVERTISTSALTDFGVQKPLLLGCFGDRLYPFKGVLDEARIETQSRSSNWIWASWMTMASNATFTACEPVIRERPQLQATSVAGSLRLAWPASGVGYSLYSATSLVAAAWTLVTNRALLEGLSWSMSLASDSEPARYFRLQAAP